MLRVLKRIILALFAFVAVIAAALYIFYFRRPPLPQAAPHAFVAMATSTIPGIEACWIETGKTFTNFSFGSTAGSILVRHPAGDLLIDAGNSSHFSDEISEFTLLRWLKLRLLAGQLGPDTPLPVQLHRVGEDPSKLRWAILSHVHLDHAGGLMDLPRLPVLLTREELQFANDRDAQAKGYVIAAHAKRLPSPDVPTLQFEHKPYAIFDERVDLYRDASVVVVPLNGHTPGSVGIFVNLSSARSFFYVGDAVDDERGFEERIGKSLILQDSDNDKPLADRIVGQLSELHEMSPNLAIIPAHGRSAYKKLFPGGPLTCVSGR